MKSKAPALDGNGTAALDVIPTAPFTVAVTQSHAMENVLSDANDRGI